MEGIMSNSKKIKSTHTTPKDMETEAEVLFQKLYGKWYAFSVVEDDCLMSEVPEEEVNKRLKRTPRAA